MGVSGPKKKRHDVVSPHVYNSAPLIKRSASYSAHTQTRTVFKDTVTSLWPAETTTTDLQLSASNIFNQRWVRKLVRIEIFLWSYFQTVYSKNCENLTACFFFCNRWQCSMVAVPVMSTNIMDADRHTKFRNWCSVWQRQIRLAATCWQRILKQYLMT